MNPEDNKEKDEHPIVIEDILDKVDLYVERLFEQAKAVAVESHGDITDDEER